MDISHFRKLIGAANTERALKELLVILKDIEPIDWFNTSSILSANLARGHREYNIGIISNAEWMSITAKTNYAFLNLLTEIEQSLPIESKPIQSKTVFISYNHADFEIALKISTALKNAGLKVIIDDEAMAAGADILNFIEKSIAASDVTLSVISNRSLLSGWVAIETVNTLMLSNFSNKKLIACYLEDDFMSDDFLFTAGTKLNNDIKELDQKIVNTKNIGYDTISLSAKRTRFFDLKSNLDKIINHLLKSLTVDIRDLNWEKGIEKVIKSILT